MDFGTTKMRVYVPTAYLKLEFQDE